MKTLTLHFLPFFLSEIWIFSSRMTEAQIHGFTSVNSLHFLLSYLNYTNKFMCNSHNNCDVVFICILDIMGKIIFLGVEEYHHTVCHDHSPLWWQVISVKWTQCYSEHILLWESNVWLSCFWSDVPVKLGKLNMFFFFFPKWDWRQMFVCLCRSRAPPGSLIKRGREMEHVQKKSCYDNKVILFQNTKTETAKIGSGLVFR